MTYPALVLICWCQLWKELASQLSDEWQIVVPIGNCRSPQCVEGCRQWIFHVGVDQRAVGDERSRRLLLSVVVGGPHFDAGFREEGIPDIGAGPTVERVRQWIVVVQRVESGADPVDLGDAGDRVRTTR